SVEGVKNWRIAGLESLLISWCPRCCALAMNAPLRNLHSIARARSEKAAQAGFVHLKVHSAYSLLEGALPIGKLAKLCQELAFPAVALTDTNNLFGVLEFSDKLSAQGVQPIAGVSIAIDFEEGRQERTGTGPSSEAARRQDGMIALYAMSERGY